MTALALGLRFLLELAALAALGWWGSTVHWALAVLAPVAAAALWGALVAPKAARRLRDPARLVVELVVFFGAGAALAAAGHAALGIALALVAAADCALVRSLGVGDR